MIMIISSRKYGLLIGRLKLTINFQTSGNNSRGKAVFISKYCSTSAFSGKMEFSNFVNFLSLRR